MTHRTVLLILIPLAIALVFWAALGSGSVLQWIGVCASAGLYVYMCLWQFRQCRKYGVSFGEWQRMWSWQPRHLSPELAARVQAVDASRRGTEARKNSTIG